MGGITAAGDGDSGIGGTGAKGGDVFGSGDEEIAGGIADIADAVVETNTATAGNAGDGGIGGQATVSQQE